VDVYEPGPGDQLHDLNPSFAPPTGLFWTVRVPDDSVTVDLAQGTATLQARDVPVLEYFTLANALSGMDAPPLPATVSFRVEWRANAPLTPMRNEVQGFAGEFARGAAQMEWTATSGQYSFTSAPLATSASTFAVLGRERNGIFLGAAS
jgi:hypothetical protein